MAEHGPNPFLPQDRDEIKRLCLFISEGINDNDLSESFFVNIIELHKIIHNEVVKNKRSYSQGSFLPFVFDQGTKINEGPDCAGIVAWIDNEPITVSNKYQCEFEEMHEAFLNKDKGFRLEIDYKFGRMLYNYIHLFITRTNKRLEKIGLKALPFCCRSHADGVGGTHLWLERKKLKIAPPWGVEKKG